MTKSEIRTIARLYALEAVVSQIEALFLLAAPGDPFQVLDFQTKQRISGIRGKSFPELGDPAMSDLMAAEIEDRLIALADQTKANLALMRRPSTSPG
jgi:hypothetical protein